MRYHCSFNGDSHFDIGVTSEPTGIENPTMSESEFIVDSIPCKMIGMNSDLMTQYIKFVADRLSIQFG